MNELTISIITMADCRVDSRNTENSVVSGRFRYQKMPSAAAQNAAAAAA
jgi:hypothetical protein